MEICAHGFGYKNLSSVERCLLPVSLFYCWTFGEFMPADSVAWKTQATIKKMKQHFLPRVFSFTRARAAAALEEPVRRRARRRYIYNHTQDGQISSLP